MAAIRKHREKCQAEICGHRVPSISRLCRQLKDTKEWARRMEAQADRQETIPGKKALETILVGDLVQRAHKLPFV
ncbi:hypothetical protein [Oricola sp.]|uniref:hypothetical protein n=1 Tax=Oricola sp. TaxID=1979950 RepID=UPI0025D7073E|nr:hypothetical protein [Oricola sp.]MCI5074704.1 hypothetical protein [Oricola sp.]